MPPGTCTCKGKPLPRSYYDENGQRCRACGGYRSGVPKAKKRKVIK